MEQRSPFNVYVNSVDVSLSNFDLVIKLAAKHPQAPESDETFGYVTMSPQHYKAFVAVLVENLNKYEALFGPVNFIANPEALKRIQAEAQVESEAAATSE